MQILNKRRLQLGCLAFLFLLLIAIYLYSQYQMNTPATLLLPESGALPELHLSSGEVLKGWEKEETIYFFIPSYVTINTLSLGTGLQWAEPESSESILQYDIVSKILLCHKNEPTQSAKKICFKHSANLYTIYMDLKGNDMDSITKQDFIETEIMVVSPDGNIDYQAEDGFVKGRGNSTWELEKKPYYLKLSEKTSFCGMDPGRKWILLANAYEGTKLSNKLLFDFSLDAGLHYAVDAEWADLYINGEYRGNYLVCEKIDVSENIVNIANLEKENQRVYQTCEPYTEEFLKGYATDQSPANITGGYIIEKDTTIADSPCGFITDHKKCFVVVSPDNASLEEVRYIREYFQNIEDLLEKHDETLMEYIDADSFARRYLIEELALNSDAFITSCYYYKKRGDGKIYAGPVWDYDAVLGESDVVDYEARGNVWQNYDETTILSMKDYRSTIANLGWEEEFQNIPAYRDTVEKAYKDLHLQLETLLYEKIDAAAAHVKQSVILDSIRWNYGENHAGHYSSYDNNVRYMKFFLAKRINFLNRRFGMEEFVYSDNTDAIHEITCVTESGETKISFKDGSLLKIDQLPKYDKEKYAGWVYEWDQMPVTGYLPVYEDMTLHLKPLASANEISSISK